MTKLLSHSDDFALEIEEDRILAAFSRRLIEIATLSRDDIDRPQMNNALNLLREPAVLLEPGGFVVEVNAAASKIFDHDVRVKDRRIFIRDIDARNSLQLVLDQTKVGPPASTASVEPIVIHRRDKLPIILRVWPMEGTENAFWRDTRLLLTLNALGPRPGPPASILAKTFGLTPSEAKLASIIARGAGPDVASQELKIARETVRNQLKSVFAKTGTHRQGELVALLLQVN